VVKSVLIYEAEIWRLYEDDRRGINTTEMDALIRSARISKLYRKTNKYIREKVNPQDTKSGGLSPPDFDLFPNLKKPLHGKRLRSIEEVSNEVT
jgi:hypothetical protein